MSGLFLTKVTFYHCRGDLQLPDTFNRAKYKGTGSKVRTGQSGATNCKGRARASNKCLVQTEQEEEANEETPLLLGMQKGAESATFV
jgi:hypothetical protein